MCDCAEGDYEVLDALEEEDEGNKMGQGNRVEAMPIILSRSRVNRSLQGDSAS